MRYLVHMYFLFGAFHICCGQVTDSLKLLLQQKQGAERIPILQELIINEWLNYPDKALEYGEESLELSLQVQDSFNISKSIRLIAGVYYYKGDYEQSLDYNAKALAIAQQLGNRSLINNGYNNLGLLYLEVGSYHTAMEYLQKSIDLKEIIGEDYGLATTLNNMGRIFDRIGAYDEARKYFERALQASLRTSDRVEIYSLNNIGFTHLKEGNRDLALKYFRRALKLGYQYENTFWGTVSMRGLAEVFLLGNVLDSAKYYINQSLAGTQSIDDIKGLGETYHTRSKYELARNNFNQAIYYLDSSQLLAKRLKVREQMISNFKLYIQIYEQLNNLALLAAYQSKYINLTDSLFRDVTSRNLSLVSVKIKEESDRIKLAEQEAEIKRQSDTNKFYIIIMVISVPGVIFLIYLLRKNKKAHEEVLISQKLLTTSEKMASLGVMAAGIAHEINNPLNFIKQGAAALRIDVTQPDSAKSEENQRLLKIIEEGVNRAAGIVASLGHFSRQSSAMDERCDLKDIIENCLLILKNRLHGKVEIVKIYGTNNWVMGNEGRLHQAIMNVLSNAEQAIPEKGTIHIKTEVQEKKLMIVIEDDGRGIPQDQLSKIGDPFFTTKSPGEGTGLGLFITYAIIQEHDGQINVSSSQGQGTVFTISLPLLSKGKS